VLESKLLPAIQQWWNPAEGATGKLMYEVDKPIPTRSNANCTEDLHQTLLPEIDWELAGKGFLGWKNDAQPNSNNFVAHEVPKALKTLLTLIKGKPVTAADEDWLSKHDIPAHTCFHYVQCIVTNNVNLHLIPALMPDSEFHGLIVTIFRLANTPLSKFCKVNPIRGEAPANPATMLWRACIDNLGSLHSASRNAPKEKQQTNITAFIPGREATPAPPPAPKKSSRKKGVKFSGDQVVAPSAAAAARSGSAATASRAAAATPPLPIAQSTAAAASAPATSPAAAAQPQSILKHNTPPATSNPRSSTTRLQLYAVIKTRDHIFRIRLRLPIETKTGSPNDTALNAFQQWWSAFEGEVQGLILLPWKDADKDTVSPITCSANFPS